MVPEGRRSPVTRPRSGGGELEDRLALLPPTTRTHGAVRATIERVYELFAYENEGRMRTRGRAGGLRRRRAGAVFLASAGPPASPTRGCAALPTRRPWTLAPWWWSSASTRLPLPTDPGHRPHKCLLTSKKKQDVRTRRCGCASTSSACYEGAHTRSERPARADRTRRPAKRSFDGRHGDCKSG